MRAIDNRPYGLCVTGRMRGIDPLPFVGVDVLDDPYAQTAHRGFRGVREVAPYGLCVTGRMRGC